MPPYINSLRILHVVSSLHVGGAEKCAVNLARIQSQLSHKVAVLSFGSPDDPFTQILASADIEYHTIQGNMLSRLYKAWAVLKRFDIIHIHSPAVIRALSPLFFYLMTKKVIYTMHGEHSASLGGMKLAHKLANIYLKGRYAVSERVRDGVKSRYNWSPANVTVVPNGVYVPASDALPPRRLPEAPFRFGMVARLVPLKQIDKVIDVFAKWVSSNPGTLHIFGDGPQREYLEKKVVEYHLSDMVTFYGNVINEDDIYHTFDCLLINSNTEGLPMVLLEAMARRRPVVSTRVGAIPALIEQSGAGLLIDVDDSAKLSSCMNKMATEPLLYNELADKAYAYVSSNFGVKQVSDIYLEPFIGAQ